MTLAGWTYCIAALSCSRTFVETALIWIEQRAHILVYDVERVRELAVRRGIWRSVVVVLSCDALAGTGAKVYDVAPVVCLLLHLLAQRAAAVASAFLSQMRVWPRML